MKNKFITYDTTILNDKSAESVVTLIQEAFVKYGKENVVFDHDSYEDYGRPVCEIYLRCQREMTESEKEAHQKRIDAEEARRQAADRVRYEQLKKQFESK